MIKKKKKMAIKKRLEYVLDVVQNEFKLDLTSNRRLRELVVARVAFANALRQFYTTVELGRVMNKDHATVCHYASMNEIYSDMELYKNVYKFTRSTYMASEFQSGIASLDIFNMVANMRLDLETLEGMIRNKLNADTTVVYDHTSKGL